MVGRSDRQTAAIKRSLQLLLIAALVLGGWNQRGNYLSGGYSWLAEALPSALINALAELATISSYPRQNVSRSKLIRNWCEPLRQEP